MRASAHVGIAGGICSALWLVHHGQNRQLTNRATSKPHLAERTPAQACGKQRQGRHAHHEELTHNKKSRTHTCSNLYTAMSACDIHLVVTSVSSSEATTCAAAHPAYGIYGSLPSTPSTDVTTPNLEYRVRKAQKPHLRLLPHTSRFFESGS